MSKNSSSLFKCLCCIILMQIVCTLSLQAQIQPPENWQHLDPVRDQVNGISLEKAYAILPQSNPKPVVVAIIDSGVDLNHEDLKYNIWVNHNELPGNGIDDDGNGYIDDVNGWNFIGGQNGQNVNHETLEITRLYGKLKGKWEGLHPDFVKKKDLTEYQLYLHAKSEVEKNREKLIKALKPIETEEQIILSAFDAIRTHLKTDSVNIEQVKGIDETSSPLLALGRQIIVGLEDSEFEFKTYSEIEEIAKEEYALKTENYRTKLDYSFNHEYNSRESIVGDNYSDSYERLYGNNDVKGPDSFHGTHVAGIVAANRSNDLGVNGVTNSALIMSIRTVPDGDERDKDVANAIRYAVDNGASIINMSFGKYYSWDKAAVDAAIKHAEKNDVLIIHAAGNNANDNDAKVHYPTDKYDKKWFLGRKGAKNWIEVGALSWQQTEKAVASFSNYGLADVDVFASGVAIKSTAPDDNYAIASGTSMAAPVVAGVAALLRAHFPQLSAAQIKSILVASSIKPNYQVSLPGNGRLVNMSDISVSGGMINAFTAVQMAMKTKGKIKIKREVLRP